MLELSTAHTAADFDDVYRFWYDIYVIEMGRHLIDANTSHSRRHLYDPLAKAGSLCVARRDGEVVGTVMTTPIVNSVTQKYQVLYGLTSLSAEERATTAITTKLMVSPAMRKTRLPLRLAMAAFDWTLHVGLQHIYIDCNDHLVRLFTRLGFQEHLPSLYLKEYGAVNSMHIDITDERHLRDVASPFLHVLQRFRATQGIQGTLSTAPQPTPLPALPSLKEARYRAHPLATRSNTARARKPLHTLETLTAETPILENPTSEKPTLEKKELAHGR